MKFGVKIVLCVLGAVTGVVKMDGVKVDSQLASVTSGKHRICCCYYYYYYYYYY
jgi:hypothetical protein